MCEEDRQVRLEAVDGRAHQRRVIALDVLDSSTQAVLGYVVIYGIGTFDIATDQVGPTVAVDVEFGGQVRIGEVTEVGDAQCPGRPFVHELSLESSVVDLCADQFDRITVVDQTFVQWKPSVDPEIHLAGRYRVVNSWFSMVLGPSTWYPRRLNNCR